VLFALVLQLMVMPDVLIVENYRTMTTLGLKDTITGIGLPYMASAFKFSCCARRSRCRAN
jgi:sn-glycerol 3-phosphate transport system permease protein